jgi:hypothetical protein
LYLHSSRRLCPHLEAFISHIWGNENLHYNLWIWILHSVDWMVISNNGDRIAKYDWHILSATCISDFPPKCEAPELRAYTNYWLVPKGRRIAQKSWIKYCNLGSRSMFVPRFRLLHSLA